MAPFTYGQLIWATAAGYVVFRALSDRWTLAGAAIIIASGATIIIASGLYTAHRARVRARR